MAAPEPGTPGPARRLHGSLPGITFQNPRAVGSPVLNPCSLCGAQPALRWPGPRVPNPQTPAPTHPGSLDPRGSQLSLLLHLLCYVHILLILSARYVTSYSFLMLAAIALSPAFNLPLSYSESLHTLPPSNCRFSVQLIQNASAK